MRRLKQYAALGLASMMAVGMLAGCGESGTASSASSSSSADTSADASADTSADSSAEAEAPADDASADAGDSGEAAAPSGDAEGITIFNSKMEIQDQMLEMAEQYTEKTGVPVEVYYSSPCHPLRLQRPLHHLHGGRQGRVLPGGGACGGPER